MRDICLCDARFDPDTPMHYMDDHREGRVRMVVRGRTTGDRSKDTSDSLTAVRTALNTARTSIKRIEADLAYGGREWVPSDWYRDPDGEEMIRVLREVEWLLAPYERAGRQQGGRGGRCFRG